MNRQNHFYKKLIEIAVKKNCKVILDSSGKNLKTIVLESKVKPYAIKPNEHEINHIENLDLKSEDELLAGPRRREVIAAISAALAVYMGTDMSGLRIRSIKRVQ